MKGWDASSVEAVLRLRGDNAKKRAVADALATVPLRARPAGTPSKYRNRKCIWNGETFDSQHELEEWIGLLARERAGEITQLKRQVPYPLFAPVHARPGAEIQIGVYIADFEYCDRDGKRHVVDAKGIRTPVFNIKKQIIEAQESLEIELI